MSYLAAVFLTYLSPEDSFLMMLTVLKRYEMIEYFKPNMPALFRSFYCLQKLTEKYLPKIHKRFNEVGFIPPMYASQWFMTIFVVDFPIETVVRIWDIFIIEGRKVIYRIALAVFKFMEKRLLDGDL